MPTPIEALRYYKTGDRLRADDVNALIDAAKLAKSFAGFYDGNAEVIKYDPGSTQVMHLRNDLGITIPPYSVFSIADQNSFTTDVLNKAVPRGIAARQTVEYNGSPLLYFTNGQIEVPANRQFQPELIGYDEPTRLRAAALSVPVVGEPCGIAYDDDALTVGSYRIGLICLSPSWLENGQNYVWVCRAREPIKVVGCVTQQITKSTIVGGRRRLGDGRISVLQRVAGNILEETYRPSAPGSKWTLMIYNQSEILYPVNTLVSASSGLGIGLVVNYEVANSFCTGTGSSASAMLERR